jgi:hypothetical protein
MYQSILCIQFLYDEPCFKNVRYWVVVLEVVTVKISVFHPMSLLTSILFLPEYTVSHLRKQ